jgi:hypothetical protein
MEHRMSRWPERNMSHGYYLFHKFWSIGMPQFDLKRNIIDTSSSMIWIWVHNIKVLCFYNLEFIFRPLYEFYMLHEFTVVLFRNIKACTHCAFMTLNSLLDCDLPLCYMGCLNTSLFFSLMVLMCFKEDKTRSFHLF